MTINGTDVRTILAADLAFAEWPEYTIIDDGIVSYDLKYRQHAVSIYESAEISQTGALGTLKNPLAPTAPRVGLKTWRIVIMFRGNSQSLFRKATSDLVSACSKEAEYAFDNLEHKFRGVLTGYESEELVQRRLYKVTLSVLGREIGDMQTYEFDLSEATLGDGTLGTITNAGTAPSAAVVSVEQLACYGAVFRLNGLLRDPMTLAPKAYTVGYRWLQGKFRSGDAVLYQCQHVMDARRGVDAIFRRPGSSSIIEGKGPYEEQAKKLCEGFDASVPSLNAARDNITPIESYGMPIILPGETELTYTLEKVHENVSNPRIYGTMRAYVWPCYL